MRERAFEPRSSRCSLTALRRASQLKTRKGGLSGPPGSLNLEMRGQNGIGKKFGKEFVCFQLPRAYCPPLALTKDNHSAILIASAIRLRASDAARKVWCKFCETFGKRCE